MGRRAEERKLGVIASLAAGVTAPVGNIQIENVRTLAITCRVAYHASAVAGVTVKCFYNHQALGVDTVPFASFVPTLTAGATVQRTVLIDSPEGQEMHIKATNEDAAEIASNIEVGYSVMRWDE